MEAHLKGSPDQGEKISVQSTLSKVIPNIAIQLDNEIYTRITFSHTKCLFGRNSQILAAEKTCIFRRSNSVRVLRKFKCRTSKVKFSSYISINTD